jgi:hypothetical protein
MAYVDFETVGISKPQSYTSISEDNDPLVNVITAAIIIMDLPLGEHKLHPMSIPAVIAEHGLWDMEPEEMRDYLKNMGKN